MLADNGAEIDVRTGLNPEDLIILNPPIGISDGMRVTVAGENEKERIGRAKDHTDEADAK